MVFQSCILGEIFPFDFRPDAALLVVIWIGLKGDYFHGILSVFTLGLALDLLSGSPLGLFSVVYLSAFLLISYISQSFDVDRLGLTWSITIVTCCVSFCIVFLARWFGGQILFESSIIKLIILKTISTSLSLLIVKPVLDGAWRGYSRLVGAS
ncbi:MAG: rod shape-determining protein MreD [Desulfomonilaceae bacterium]